MNNNKEKSNDSVEVVAARTNTDNPAWSSQDSIAAGILDPCTIVIVGASGDLTARKLIPALYSLFLNKALPHPFLIVGCSRTRMTDEEFRGRMQEALEIASTFNTIK
ncbi:MAG: hypothetical protein HY787_28045, partial [Deltaproteobacteria bacterium]|nr:hypothetical protein [Deltaproteobacteria bacterium]